MDLDEGEVLKSMLCEGNWVRVTLLRVEMTEWRMRVCWKGLSVGWEESWTSSTENFATVTPFSSLFSFG